MNETNAGSRKNTLLCVSASRRDKKHAIILFRAVGDKGAGASAEPAHRPLTLFNSLITVPRESESMFGCRRERDCLKMTANICSVCLESLR